MFKKKNTKTLKVNGKLVECCSVKGLADILGKSRDTVMRYEQFGYFPMAPLRLGGYRYYPVSLAKRLKEIVKRFPPNKAPSAELRVEVNKLFNEERSKLCQQQNVSQNP